MIKKILGILLVLAMILAFAGCGEKHSGRGRLRGGGKCLRTGAEFKPGRENSPVCCHWRGQCDAERNPASGSGPGLGTGKAGAL